MYIIPLIIIVLLLLAGVGFYLYRKRFRWDDQAALVGQFYDAHGDAFLQVYGDVIQAFRTTDVSKLLDYEAAAMGMKEGMKVLDAGCGVCGPAIYFAKNYNVHIDALTASEKTSRCGRRKN